MPGRWRCRSRNRVCSSGIGLGPCAWIERAFGHLYARLGIPLCHERTSRSPIANVDPEDRYCDCGLLRRALVGHDPERRTGSVRTDGR